MTALVAAAFWPVAFGALLYVAHKAFHRYLDEGKVTSEHEKTLAAVCVAVKDLETNVSARLKEIEDRVKGDTSFRTLSSMMAPPGKR